MSAVKIADASTWNNLLESIDTVLLDCDGVLWVGSNDVIHNGPEAVSYIRSLGKKLCFVTNNSSKTRLECLEKLHKLGFEAFEVRDLDIVDN
jgi:ribonucleotide monophosphatase NagD (HAD superfamily)